MAADMQTSRSEKCYGGVRLHLGSQQEADEGRSPPDPTYRAIDFSAFPVGEHRARIYAQMNCGLVLRVTVCRGEQASRQPV